MRDLPAAMPDKPFPPAAADRRPRVDLSTRRGRRLAELNLQISDHGLLRHLWHNEEEIAPGVWRANQPNRARFRAYADRGIRAVLTLRGASDQPHQVLSAEGVKLAGLIHYRFPLKARRLVPRDTLLRLLDLFEVIERPFVMHCKSGADRSGLASFLYLLSQTDTPPEVARRQLSWRYIHFRGPKTGILDHFADTYLAAHAATGIGIRDWIETVYDPASMTADYAARRGTGS